MLATYGVLGAVLELRPRSARQAGGDPAAIEGWFLLGGTIIMALKVAWFWGGRHDIAAFFRGDFSGGEPGLIRRAAALSLPYLLIGVALAIWFAGNIAAADPQRGHWGTVAGATQVLVILLPIAALGIDALAKSLIARQIAQSSTPLRVATAASARAAIAGGVWVIGLYVIVRMWDLFLPDPSSQAALAAVVRIGAALVTGWAIWSFLSVYFEAHMPKPRSGQPGDEDEGEPLVQTRLTTVLPIVRDLSFGATIAITALIALSAVGVDIGPLLAGFGIVGLAISLRQPSPGQGHRLGHLLHDRRRLSDRRVYRHRQAQGHGRADHPALGAAAASERPGSHHPLRHDRPGHQLSARLGDDEVHIRLDRDADIEKARKTIKKLGQRDAGGPGTRPEFLLPLKMQGVQEIADAAIVIRCKFTAKPGKPTWSSGRR